MEIKTLPPLVAQVFFSMPYVSLELYNKALDEYPEYFKDEVARRDKMNTIHNEVHKKYLDDVFKFYDEIFDNFCLMDVFEKGKIEIKYNQSEKEKRLKEIWDKHYKKYGIEYGN